MCKRAAQQTRRDEIERKEKGRKGKETTKKWLWRDHKKRTEWQREWCAPGNTFEPRNSLRACCLYIADHLLNALDASSGGNNKGCRLDVIRGEDAGRLALGRGIASTARVQQDKVRG